MVGIPRSKGCRICVQRRVKCDQTRPTCLRCQKGNRPCPGYEFDMKFQDEGPKLRQHYKNKTSHKAPDHDGLESSEGWHNSSGIASLGASAYPTPASSTQAQDVQSTSDTSDTHSDPSALQVQLRERPSLFSVFDDNLEMPFDEDTFDVSTDYIEGVDNDSFGNIFLQPCTSIFSPLLQQDQLLSCFSSSIAPQSQVELAAPMRNHGRWLSSLPAFAGMSPLLDTAIRACTLAHFGRLHNSQVFMQESQNYYGKALRLLNQSLQDSDQGMSSQTLSATILLSFYEMFQSDSDTAWIRHAGGAGTLMKLRGPAVHRTGFDREIFLAYRHALIIQSFEIDKPCFLDEPGWRQLCKDIHQDIRDSGACGDRIEIFDISETFFEEWARLPGLVYDARDTPRLIKAANGDKEMALAELKARAYTHRASLKGSFMRLTSALKKAGQEPTSHVSTDPIFPQRLTYINVFIAANHTGYWTTMIIMNLVLKELDKAFPEQVALYTMENVEMAQKCCRSEEYMAASSFLGPFFVIFALRVSLLVLEDYRQRAWILGKLIELGHSKLSMAKTLPVGNPQSGMPRVRRAVQDLEAMEGRSHYYSPPLDDSSDFETTGPASKSVDLNDPWG